MSEEQAQAATVEIEVTAPSVDILRELLELPRGVREGTEVPLASGATLTISEVSKSSGFDATR